MPSKGPTSNESKTTKTDKEETIMTSITSAFTPIPTSHSRRSVPLVSTTSPLITSILYKIFPILIIFNTTLDFITWTSHDPFMNFIYHSMLYLLIFYYDVTIYFFFVPILTVLVISSINHYVNSVYIHVNEEEPTLEEIVDTLDNFTTRVDILLEPFRAVQISYLKLLNFLFMITPVHLVLMKYFLQPKTFLLSITIMITTFHSLWFQATLKILWRSLFVRNIFSFFIGTNTAHFYNNYRILNETKISNDKNGKIIQFQIIENQRRWVGLGWSDKLLPYERANFTNEALQETSSPDSFLFPFNSKQWQWLEEKWNIDLKFCDNKNKDGWKYFDNYWQSGQTSDSITSYTRSRKWTRKAVLISEKTKSTSK
ncbi:Peroxisomal membrane protein PEX31 [Wickerhamomyces ciferrii]|uniref:Peroxisomal membrane protein PEX31 n=1 Tax=Wickerhamomyces ciferrii (strain ATCC 14091 / BCRC 22168 / CBS 111 / JCM 3599 / NBRC 0793 / NRRL Y-1031 F-60-10) TaxID=1206466 RepID=K0KIM7_WICCF|nr:Peroxisomal membrane protein PEX31 [Wickerhamomyces ciferrii]CCH45070.1 Peroxisomal membrane protein PEX31 [Wickerhamomyces ciferrii]